MSDRGSGPAEQSPRGPKAVGSSHSQGMHREPRRPRWRRLRWIVAGVLLAFLAVGLWNLFGPEPPIRVSPETTFLTEPLAADGLPDYGAAVLAAMGPAPNPGENAAVELLQVMWPLGIDAADLPAVCKALGIPDSPPADPLREPTEDSAAKLVDDMYDAPYERPWTGKEFPELEAWLIAHEAALDRLVAAADRPRYWLPGPTLLQPGPQLLIGELLPDIQEVRSAARLLGYRAMWHAGAGRHAAAWRDIRAIYRFSRLLADRESTPQFLVTQMLATSLNATADAAVVHGLLGLPDLPIEALATIRRDLDALGPLPRPSDGLASERLFSIDAIVWLARRAPGGRAAQGQMDDLSSLRRPKASLDWNAALERVNVEYDKVEAAARLPIRAARQTELERLATALDRRMVGRLGWGNASQVIQGLCSRGNRGVLVGDMVLALMMPATGNALDALARGRASFALSRTAAALAAFRADRAAGDAPYPETLDALAPRYLSAVPLDPFTEKPFVYERHDDGYLLASVGVNGVYDGGDDMNGWIVDGEWRATKQDVELQKSDIVVRMPVPQTPPAKP